MIKIKSIEVYQINLPIKEGKYKWSNKNFVDTFDSTVVKLITNNGYEGLGEVCTLGPNYLPAYSEGVRTGIKKIGQNLIGLDPTNLININLVMDSNLKGHNYVKSPIDIACWDIKGQVTGIPVCEMLGGRYGDDFVLYRAISQIEPEAMAANVKHYRDEGYRRFQLKVGSNPDEDIDRIRLASGVLESGDKLIADANTGWLMHEAARVVRAVDDVDVYIEQPCETYEECLSIRERTSHPFILDEVIDGIDILVRGHAERAMDVVNIKISKFGGLTKASLARDLCVKLGIAMTLEDSWGGDITTASISHLAHSTPEEYLFTATDFNSYVTVSSAEGAPQRNNGRMTASKDPGLGIKPKMDVLGNSVLEIS